MKPPIEFLRPLGVAERFNWLVDKQHSSNFAVLLEIDGPLEAGALDRALNPTARRHPMLNVITGVDPRGAVRWAKAPNVPIVTASNEIASEDGWLVPMREFLDRPFPTGAYPLVTSDLFRLDDNHTFWMMGFHHPIADAKSASLFMMETLTRLGAQPQPDADPEPLAPALEDLYPPTLQGARGLPRYVVAFVRFMMDTIRIGRPKPIPGYNTEPFAPRKTRLVPLNLTADETAALAERCKRERTTLNGAIMAAQIVALDETHLPNKSKPHGIVSAVNLRSRLADPIPDARMGYFVSLLIKLYKRRPNETFWDLARRTRDKLAVGIERGEAHMLWKVQPPNAFFPPNEKGIRRIMDAGRFWPPTSFLSNIGRVPLAENNNGPSIRSLRFAIGAMPNMTMVASAATIQGKLSMICAFDDARLPEGVADSIVDRMCELLID